MKVSDYIASYLEQRGVTCVFEVVGGMITHLLDSLHLNGHVRIISMHHEQTAAFAAEGLARMTGLPGVALATSGPGAVNLLTGIGSCYFDSIPAVFITGQVNRHELKGNRPIRQLGFQETDIVAMARPITKAAWQIQAPDDVPEMLRRAFTLALSDRPGPVLLDIPMDVQRAQIEVSDHPPTLNEEKVLPELEKMITQLLKKLGQAQRPMILAGGGIRSSRSIEPFRRLIARLKVPVVHSLMGSDLLSFDDPLRVGLIGTYGNRWANLALGRSDYLLVLGSRLDVRQTGSDTAAFKGAREIYQVDIEAGEINNRVKGCHGIISHLCLFLETALNLAIGQPSSDRGIWQAEITELRRAWPDTAELKDCPGINPNELMHHFAQRAVEAIAFVVDVGQHQMWAAQSLELSANQRFVTSGGMGAMGFALPAAIGVAFTAPGHPVAVVAGDGSFQLNSQELHTVAHHNLPIKMLILNNRSYGMVRQFQQSYFKERYQSTCWGYSVPDFVAVARAYGIVSARVVEPAKVETALAQMWQNPTEPYLLEMMIDTSANVYPKIAFSKPFTEMEPFTRPSKMESP